MSRVLVVGLGYVGLPVAVGAAEAGHVVVGVDTDVERINAVMAGQSPVEDVSDSALQAVLTRGAFRAVAVPPDAAVPAGLGFDIAVVAVPTPLRDGVPDLSYLDQAAALVGACLERDGVVVFESTTYPGTTERRMAPILEAATGLRAGIDFHLGYSPERIDPGSTVHTFATTPKLVSATTPAGLALVQEFYDSLVDTTVPVSSPAAAEFTKLFENIFRQVNIGLVNELAMVAHELGVDIWEILDAADTKGHAFLKHTPGPGVGGHCIPVDPVYLSWLVQEEFGHGLLLSDAAQQINTQMPAYVATRAAAMLPGGLEGARILVLGVSYKKGTCDLRETPARPLVAHLRAAGAAVDVTDPHMQDWEEWTLATGAGVLESEAVVAGIGDYDLAIVCTDHDEFDYDKIARQARRILDCRHRLAPGPQVVAL